MPNLSKTTLEGEIDYELDNYKLNESSKLDSNQSCDNIDTSISKFKSIGSYTNITTEVQPKFMNALNVRSYIRKPGGDLDTSDKSETQELINSLK